MYIKNYLQNGSLYCGRRLIHKYIINLVGKSIHLSILLNTAVEDIVFAFITENLHWMKGRTLIVGS